MWLEMLAGDGQNAGLVTIMRGEGKEHLPFGTGKWLLKSLLIFLSRPDDLGHHLTPFSLRV